MSQSERFAALKRAAWEARDLDLYEFYSGLEYDLKRLRAVGRAVNHLYKNGGNDVIWNALFEALFDAEGLLTGADLADEDEEDDDPRDFVAEQHARLEQRPGEEAAEEH